jgi:hypothetical protein
MGARRHRRHTAAEAHRAKRDRGRPGHYKAQGTVAWPTMGDGTQWVQGLARVTHVDRPPEEEGTMEPPKLVDGVWQAVVAWDAVGRHAQVIALVPLDRLLPA